MVRQMLPAMNNPNEMSEIRISPKDIGTSLFLPFFSMSHLAKNGCSVLATSKTQSIPIMVISPIDFNAGCFANISTPMPINVVNAERKIEVL